MNKITHFPIQVMHVDLDEITATGLNASTETVLIVFWKNNIPMGQTFTCVEPHEPIKLQELAQSAAVPYAVDAASRPITKTDTFKVSIVICTRDRPDELARCLASFSNQTRQPEQVLVVDNASKDERTMLVARRAGVDYIREDRPGLDIARNAGATRAEGDIVVYTDDDVVIHPHWLQRIVAAFDADDIMAVTGLVLPAELETEAQYTFERYWSFGRGYARIDFGKNFFARYRNYGCPAWEIGAGANMAFRKTIFDEIGLFDERLDVGAAGCSGDSEYWYRILAHGWRCRYEPTAVVFHYHRRTFEGLARQLEAYMRGHVTALLVQFERTRQYGNLRRIFVSMPFWYARRLLKRLLRGRDLSNRFLAREIKGALSGIIYYLTTKQPASHRIQ